MEVKRNKILKILIQGGLIAVVLVLVYISVESVLPGVIKVLANGTDIDVQEYLRQFNDIKGYAVGFFLQFIQIITIILPSIPIQIATGIVFGVWRGFLVCFLGYISANAVIFILVRKLGSSLEKILPTAIDKAKNTKKKNAILDSEHPAFMVFLATTFPILPNGIIPYVAAKTRVRFTSFMAAVSVGCVPTILTLCTVGKKIIKGDLLSAALYVLPLLLFFLVMFWQQKNLIKLYTKLFKAVSDLKQKLRAKRAAKNQKYEETDEQQLPDAEIVIEPENENESE